MEYGWLSIVPPLIAIGLALITKEVFSSLFIGIITGALILSNFSFSEALTRTFGIMFNSMSDPEWNIPILAFLALLGGLIALITAAGGSKAYGDWASKRISSRQGAQLATFGLGFFIFIDDYFNSLTVGTVMKPVTDRFRISRAKLAYVLDSTAAPITILAPISSWVAYIMSIMADQFEAANLTLAPFNVFLETLAYNYYAWLALIFVLVISLTNIEFGPMAKFEKRAIETGQLQEERGVNPPGEQATDILTENDKSSPWDLLLPIIVLIILTVISMLFTGGYFAGDKTLLMAFGDTNAALSLVYAGFAAIVFTFALYMPRKLLSFSEFINSFVDGIKSMVPSFLVLIMAWSIGSISSDLGTGEYVAQIIKEGFPVQLMPVGLFIIGGLIAFATGTSWGTFAIMLPIAIPVAATVNVELLPLFITSVLAGGVFGDHVSPISDTTILSSTGASCHHIDHVATQWPYATLVAVISAIGFLVAGYTNQTVLSFAVALILLITAILILSKLDLKVEQ